MQQNYKLWLHDNLYQLINCGYALKQLIVLIAVKRLIAFEVVIAERCIPLAVERVATPVISDSYVATPIKGGVLCAVEVTLAIDRFVIAIANLIAVTKTINDGILVQVNRDVSFAIRVEISIPVHRDVPVPIRRNVSVAIHRNITTRTKLLFSLGVPFTHPFVPGEIPLPNCSWRR